ncbi:MAG: peptidoglycan DD-metalloendopeptidase family protein [Porphyromonas sp.]|nr:peptidoglycan DD-metalloendopeptidase family protein [Porphyromonas sp.]
MKCVWRYIPLLLVLTLFVVQPFMAQTPPKSAAVQKLERQRKSILESIERVNQLLKKASTDAKSSLQQLQLLESQIRSREKIIQTLEAEIKVTESQIVEFQVRIAELEEQFAKRQKSYVSSIRAMQRRTKTEDQLLFILSAEDFAQGLRRARYLAEYATWQKKEGEKLRALREELDREKANLEAQKEQKEVLLTSRKEEQANLENDRSKSRAKVKELRGQEKELQQELKRQRAQAAALNKQIEQQIAREIAAAEEAARKQKGQTGKATRQAATKGGYAMTEAELKLSSNFAENRGKLPAPISGYYTVIAPFGIYSPEGLRNVRVNNSGIDIQGAQGAEARAVFDGVVTKIFVVEGYDNSVIVRHGNYLTVYSNLTTVYVKTGDKVSTGQALGKLYSDPALGGATKLHFQLWKERTKLDPQLWIR